MTDLVVAGGTVVTPDGPVVADVAIAYGRIERIGPELGADGVESIDATGKLVLPGVIDVHTHLRLPDAEHPHRFSQDTLAAAAGGTTTVLTFNNPGTGISDDGARSLLRGLDEFRARTAGESAVDFGLCAVISGQQDDPVAEAPVDGLEADDEAVEAAQDDSDEWEAYDDQPVPDEVDLVEEHDENADDADADLGEQPVDVAMEDHQPAEAVSEPEPDVDAEPQSEPEQPAFWRHPDDDPEQHDPDQHHAQHEPEQHESQHDEQHEPDQHEQPHRGHTHVSIRDLFRKHDG